MARILITGGKGMLGRTLQRELVGHELCIADLPETDICECDAFCGFCSEFRPDTVIHCAAMTRVDDCESREKLAFRLNETGSANVATACRRLGARLVAISTDYVFSGDLPPGEAWRETDEPSPRTVYGKSKLAGERAIMDVLHSATILRIAWLYGSGGPSFIHTMAKLGAQEGEPLKVVNDQRGNPTSAVAVAGAIKFLLDRPEVNGVVHGTCEGVCTWYDLACELFRLLGLRRLVTPCTTAEYPRPAPRPANSALSKTVFDALGYRMPSWQTALSDFVASEFSR